MIKNYKNTNNAFTLIELLVVVAIIGILSSVVITSLNSAREKSKIASIKSTLKQLYNQAAINQVENGSFTGSNPSYSNLTCSGNLAPIIKPLEDQGIIVKCFSFYGSPYGGNYTGDDYNRFAATALIYDTGELKAWSVDENGVVKWDTQGVNSTGAFVTPDITASWTNAQNRCALSGGRLPSIEQLRTLSHAWYSKANTDGDVDPWAPLGFVASIYWSSTPVPSSPTTLAYGQIMAYGSLTSYSQTLGYYVRCVR